MKKFIKIMLLIIMPMMVASCGSTISDGSQLIVLEKGRCPMDRYKYRYVLFNNTDIPNVTFYSNEDYDVGDTLKFTKK